MSIREFLIDDHRHCDDFYAAAEQAVERNRGQRGERQPERSGERGGESDGRKFGRHEKIGHNELRILRRICTPPPPPSPP